MAVEAGVVAMYVIAWAGRKARRAGVRLDAAINARLERLYDVVETKLAGHSVLAEVVEESASEDGQVSDLTRQQVELAVKAAAHKDEVFGQAVTELVAQLRAAEQTAGQSVLSDIGVNIAGGVDIHADNASVAAWTMGTVTVGQTPVDPSQPGRLRD